MNAVREWIQNRVQLQADTTGGAWSVRNQLGELSVWARGIEVAAYIGRNSDPDARADAAAIVDAHNNAGRAYAALSAAVETMAEHYTYQLKREAKFGRSGSACVCTTCHTMRAIEDKLGLEENR